MAGGQFFDVFDVVDALINKRRNKVPVGRTILRHLRRVGVELLVAVFARRQVVLDAILKRPKLPGNGTLLRKINRLFSGDCKSYIVCGRNISAKSDICGTQAI